MILYPYQIISTSNVRSANLLNTYSSDVRRHSEVVNPVHERDLFLALGNDVMDDVHLFAVVDTGVQKQRLRTRKRCTHNFTL